MRAQIPGSDVPVIAVVPIWGFDYITTKVALRGLNPFVYAELRFVFASILLMVVQRRFANPGYSSQALLKIAAAGVIGVSVYRACYTTGLKYIGASEASWLIATSPIFTAFVAAGFGSEKLVKKQVIGATIALAGVGFVVSRGLSGLQFQPSALLGYILMLITAALFGFRSVVLQPVLEQYPSIPTVTRAILAGTFALLVISIFPFFSQDWKAVDNLCWLAVGYGALFSTAIGYVLWYRGVGRIGATRTMLYYYLVPLSAVLFSVLFLDEKFTLSIVAGGLLIFAGVTVTKWEKTTSEGTSKETGKMIDNESSSRV
jgi:drug/metabolite transporter (DMT)-like permease